MHVITFEFCMCKGHTNSILKAEQTSVPVVTPGAEFSFPGKTIRILLNYCAFFGELVCCETACTLLYSVCRPRPAIVFVFEAATGCLLFGPEPHSPSGEK